MRRWLIRQVSRVTLILSVIFKRVSVKTSRYHEFLSPPKYEWLQILAGPAIGSWVYTKSGVLRDKLLAGRYEYFLFKALEENSFDFDSKQIWDIGAHHGFLTLIFANLVGPSGGIVAAEPNPDNVVRIRNMLVKNPLIEHQVTVIDHAISNMNGQAFLKRSTEIIESDLGYLDELGAPSDRIAREVYDSFVEISVPTVTIDSLVDQIGKPPNLIKIDVEGAEANVLAGATMTLRDHAPSLLIEVHNIQCMHEVVRQLTSIGYQTRLIDDNRKSSSRAFVFAKRSLIT